MGGRAAAGAASREAGAARHARRDPGRVGAARGCSAAAAAGGDGRHRRHGLCAPVAGCRSAECGVAERHCRALDRIVRGAAICVGPGGDAGVAGGIGGRRACRQRRARHAGGVRARLRCRRAHRRRVHAAPARAPKRAGVAVGGGGGGRTLARSRRRRGQPRDAHCDGVDADAQLHERRCGRHGAERRRRHERVRRGTGAGTGAGGVRSTARRDRGVSWRVWSATDLRPAI